MSVSEDGCVILWKITDKEGAALLRDKKLMYSNEILITKSELEEKVRRSSEGRRQVWREGGGEQFVVESIVLNILLLLCMYVYCTFYAPICCANGMEKASFARIVGAGVLHILCNAQMYYTF